MDLKPQNLGRAYLVGKLRKRGLSRRQTVYILNAIFREMAAALSRGRSVEFPFGKLKRVKRRFNKYWEAIDDHPANRAPYTVEWQLDEAGDQLLNGWKPAKKGRRGKVPKSPESGLGGRPRIGK